MMVSRAAHLNIKVDKDGKTVIGQAIHSDATIYNLEKHRDEERYSQKKRDYGSEKTL